MTTLEKYLKKIYFNPKNPVSFGGAKRLWEAAKKKGYHPTYSYVQSWLRDQESYSIHKPVRHDFKRRRIVVANPDSLWDMDLMDLTDISEDNDGVKYLLVIVDAMSKFGFIRPLKSKKATEVRDAFKDVLLEGRKPIKLRTDKGAEFRNRWFKQLAKDEDIYLYFAQNENKAFLAERLIKTLKRKIILYLTHNNTRRYIDTVQSFVSAYNNAVHRTIKMKPSQVTPQIAKKLWWKMYKPKTNLKLKPYKYRVGQTVRVSYLKDAFSREYDQSFSYEIFTIRKRFRVQGIAQYQLKDILGEPILGSWYEAEIQPVTMDMDKPFKINKILKHRTKNKKKEVLVSWKGYSDPRMNSWIPADSVENL